MIKDLRKLIHKRHFPSFVEMLSITNLLCVCVCMEPQKESLLGFVYDSSSSGVSASALTSLAISLSGVGTANSPPDSLAGTAESFPKMIPACPLMIMKIDKTADPKMENPMMLKAFSYDNWRKPSPKQTAPVLPPAPTIPEIEPVAGGSTYGTIPYEEPSADWTNKLKATMTAMAPPRLLVLAKTRTSAPSAARRIVWAQIRPFIPHLAFILSDKNPPRPRAKRFIQPKIDAMAAADSVD
mmetsp:Transcript_46748/g.113939  ORF Transcript_46748/g.113939 Transcript_46748/m.113939 type:complete len:240 (-) Transcript_46748:1109-1828(-)